MFPPLSLLVELVFLDKFTMRGLDLLEQHFELSGLSQGGRQKVDSAFRS